jgi:cytoskeletal protein CcmA (bactofilin family)
LKLSMRNLNLKVLTPEEFVFLETRKPDGVYNYDTYKILHNIIEKLKGGKKTSSRAEKNLCKIFSNANFGILLNKNSETWEKITHSGKVQISGKFAGEIEAQAILIEKNASVVANIVAEVVMCKGKVFGNIRATYKIKISKDAEVKGNIHSPKFILEKGAVFDGQCTMPNVKQTKYFHFFEAALGRPEKFNLDPDLSY